MFRSLAVALLLGFAGTQAQTPLSVSWLPNPETHNTRDVARWAAAVGPPLLIQRTMPATAPPAESIIVVTWNVHGQHGRIADFIGQLKTGALTGTPVSDFVLLIQEAVRIRRLPPPEFEPGMKKAPKIDDADPLLPDIAETADAMNLTLLYVPSMRNGEAREDRGNAILSTLPLVEAYAFELPLRRQRRVGIAATVTVRDGEALRPLRLVNVHFDTSEGPSRLYVLGNPRPEQARATLRYIDMMATRTPLAVLGGDMNTFLPFEDAANNTRRDWSRNQGSENRESTFATGRLDHLFFRLTDPLCGHTRRAPAKFGSDHHPVIGRFERSLAGACGVQ
jgi:endonuclease/exonuclease/phosphatase family metal-dependent hydrolase